MSKAEAGSIGGSSKDQNDTCLQNTAENLAKEYGVTFCYTVSPDAQGQHDGGIFRYPLMQGAVI